VTAAHPHDAQIRALYASFLDGWNRRSGAAVAAGFADDGDIIPAGANDLDPDLHTVHTLVAVDEGRGRWRISLFQATPAAWHGHEHLREELTEELRGLLAPQ
jgi:hypothetical protein